MSSHSKSREESRSTSSPSRRRSDSSGTESPEPRRRGSGSSSSTSKRDSSRKDDGLPKSFGTVDRIFENPADDNLNVIERMSQSYSGTPLEDLYLSVKEGYKVKIWTRNYKEIRGICTGYVMFFDKHWNIMLRDVDEVYIKSKKGKTPYIGESKSQGKAAKGKDASSKEVTKDADDPASSKSDVPTTSEADATATSKEDAPAASEPAVEDVEMATKKKKRRKKTRVRSTTATRSIKHLFIRGDNIVTILLCKDEPEPEVEPESDDVQLLTSDEPEKGDVIVESADVDTE